MKQSINIEYTEEEFKSITGMLGKFFDGCISIARVAAESSERRADRWAEESQMSKVQETIKNSASSIQSELTRIRSEIEETNSRMDSIEDSIEQNAYNYTKK